MLSIISFPDFLDYLLHFMFYLSTFVKIFIEIRLVSTRQSGQFRLVLEGIEETFGVGGRGGLGGLRGSLGTTFIIEAAGGRGGWSRVDAAGVVGAGEQGTCLVQ